VSGSRQATVLTWVFRPDPSRPAALRALAGSRVYAMSQVGDDGRAEVVLHDGTRLRATPAEIVVEWTRRRPRAQSLSAVGAGGRSPRRSVPALWCPRVVTREEHPYVDVAQ
jgi:hypothetical protein